jgi:hypothetical protein
MRKVVTNAIRWITGVALLILSIPSLVHGQGLGRTLALIEIVACVAFCLPRIWSIGGGALLAVLGITFTNRALQGHFESSVLFAAFVVILELFYGRP